MSKTKLFRKKDLDLEPVNGMKIIGLLMCRFQRSWVPGSVMGT
jgi:hypothetical protein